MQHVSSRVSSRRSSPSPTTPESRPLRVERLGLVPYGAALDLQQQLVERRRAGDLPDTLLLLQHPHVITLGTSAHREHVLIDDEQGRVLGLDVFETGRGGDVTYHGPGQLVGYPIFDLKPDRCDLHRYVRDLEEALIIALRTLGIDGQRKPGLTGVWTGDAKLAAIGVRVSRGWITSHGFALNVATDLAFFDSIVPCGIKAYGVTSLAQLLLETDGDGDGDGLERIAFARVEDAIVAAFCDVFSFACND